MVFRVLSWPANRMLVVDWSDSLLDYRRPCGQSIGEDRAEMEIVVNKVVLRYHTEYSEKKVMVNMVLVMMANTVQRKRP